MMRSAVRKLVAAGLVVGAAGCEPKVVDLQVRLVTSACVAPSPIEGVTHLRFRVTGEGIDPPLERVAGMGDAVQAVPEIPVGTGRMLEVRGYDGDPASGGEVISIGHTLPFDVPEVVPEADRASGEVAVFLRRVDAFTPPSLAVSPTICTRMLNARAGHTATVMDDGRVLIAGGFSLKSDDGGRTFHRATLASAEFFNPATGGFDKGPELGVFNAQQLFTPAPRAFHGATLLPNGKVLLAGGEVRSGQSYFATPSALVYDPASKRFNTFAMKQARIGPGLAREPGGRVLIVGGSDTFGMPVGAVEWVDPAKPFANATSADPTRENPRVLEGVTAPRVGMSVAPVQEGRFIAVAGGWDGAKLADEVLFFSFDGSTFLLSPSTVRLAQVRRGAGIGWFGRPDRLIVAGGYASATEPQTALSSSEVISTGDAFNVSAGGALTEPRGDLCVATLHDGRVLVVGGRATDGAAPESSVKVELITPLSDGGASVRQLPSLPAGRYYHSCTTLLDGSVLVLGGVQETAAGRSSLQDAYLFVPKPLD